MYVTPTPRSTLGIRRHYHPDQTWAKSLNSQVHCPDPAGVEESGSLSLSSRTSPLANEQLASPLSRSESVPPRALHVTSWAGYAPKIGAGVCKPVSINAVRGGCWWSIYKQSVGETPFLLVPHLLYTHHRPVFDLPAQYKPPIPTHPPPECPPCMHMPCVSESTASARPFPFPSRPPC